MIAAEKWISVKDKEPPQELPIFILDDAGNEVPAIYDGVDYESIYDFAWVTHWRMRPTACKSCGKPTTHYNTDTKERLCSLCTRHYHIATLRHALDHKTCDRVHGLFTLLELQRGCWDVRDGPDTPLTGSRDAPLIDGYGRIHSADSWSPTLASELWATIRRPWGPA